MHGILIPPPVRDHPLPRERERERDVWSSIGRERERKRTNERKREHAQTWTEASIRFRVGERAARDDLAGAGRDVVGIAGSGIQRATLARALQRGIVTRRASGAIKSGAGRLGGGYE